MKYINYESKRNIYSNYGKISKRFSITKATTKKRIDFLINNGLLVSKKTGKTKVLLLTKKGENLITQET